MLYYYIVFILLIFNIFIRNRLFIYFIFSLMFFISAFRYKVGFDWYNYEQIYEVSTGFFLKEPLFLALINFCNNLNFSFQTFIFICTFITLFFYFKSLNFYFSSNLKVFSLSILYFFLTYSYFEHFNIIRQGLVIAIFFFSWRYVIERKFFSYFAVILCCSLIHSSAILLLPFYFLLNFKFNRFFYISIIVFSLIFSRFNFYNYYFSVFNYFSFLDFVDRYISDPELNKSFFSSKSDLGLSKIYPAIIFIFGSFFVNFKNINKQDLVFYNAGFFAVLFNILGYQIDIFFRFFSFFEISFCYMYIFLFSSFKSEIRVFLHYINIFVYTILLFNMLFIMGLDEYFNYIFDVLL
ncbi:EpsG family protein [Acinetobacter ursingii]|uniref:EpsG family protein n=1 Tax=Acinetobacter ursingii TaxID=108980 RepID=UPI0030097239